MSSAAPMPSPKIQTVQVTFDGRGLSIDPDQKEVSRGDVVVWNLRDKTGETGRWRWTVYFRHGSPFRSMQYQFITTSQELGSVNAGQAEEPGEWKYGVRVEYHDTGQIRGDEDPYLVVR